MHIYVTGYSHILMEVMLNIAEPEKNKNACKDKEDEVLAVMPPTLQTSTGQTWLKPSSTTSIASNTMQLTVIVTVQVDIGIKWFMCAPLQEYRQFTILVCTL